MIETGFGLWPVEETFFDQIVETAGGQRLDDQKRSRQGRKTPDYQIEDCFIELKFLLDEPQNKRGFQDKLAEIFRRDHEKRPVQLIDFSNISYQDRLKLRRIVSNPLKTHIRKAAKQLKSCTQGDYFRILWIHNQNFKLVSHETLVSLAQERLQNDTRSIDVILLSGSYIYGDDFESYAFSNFDTVVRANSLVPTQIIDKLKESFHGWQETRVTALIRGEYEPQDLKEPPGDYWFEKNGILFIKPAEKMGQSSDFYGVRRPRVKRTGLTLPDVAVAPVVTQALFDSLSNHFPDDFFDGLTIKEVNDRVTSSGSTDDIMVFAEVDIADFLDFCSVTAPPYKYDLLQYFLKDSVYRAMNAHAKSASNHELKTILVPDYILVTVEEVGKDEMFDISKIERCRDIDVYSYEAEMIGHWERWPFDHAVPIGALNAYIRGQIPLFYRRETRYRWE